MAGQFAKPRSSPTEIVNGREVPSFRFIPPDIPTYTSGEIINGIDPDDREPDPDRLLQYLTYAYQSNFRAYFHSATTLNYLRALLSSGFASLHSPQEWSLGHVRSSRVLKEYTATVTSVLDCLDFMAHIGADNPFVSEVLDRTEIFTSHEALLLDYEERLTHQTTEGWIDGSAHYIWVGERTRDLSGAHIEFIRGVDNPIGIKLGPTLSGEELIQLLDIVNPNCEIGKVTLICRYGHAKVPSPARIVANVVGRGSPPQAHRRSKFLNACRNRNILVRPHAREYPPHRHGNQNPSFRPHN
jgi:3-deoxy-7-phosphoheptulonate synthase